MGNLAAFAHECAAATASDVECLVGGPVAVKKDRSLQNRNGAITLVENGACHARHWKNVELEECRRFGVNSCDGSGNFA